MVFSDPVFFIFFAIYFFFHAITPPNFRNATIIFGSTVFYAYWKPSLVFIPYLLTAVAYLGAVGVERADTDAARRRRLAVSVTVLLLPLIFYKYTNFIAGSVIALLVPMPETVIDVGLPLGISFVTFTAIAYVANVYSGKFKAERNVLTVSAFFLFFPHLIAGPILRPHELIPQLRRPLPALDARFVLGIAIFTVGLVKKLVFADQMAVFVDQAYAGEGPLHGLDYLVAVYGFALQIYCDFSGYTDMAIGLAILLRVRLPQNFRRPYAAANLVDFWRTWHITLSMWLRDYLYIPLGGSRRGFSRQIAAVLVTMGLGGLWHGANWTFVLWGLVHGAGIAFLHAMRSKRIVPAMKPLPRWLGVAVTFHFVTLAWILFRAPDLETAWRVLSGPFVGPLDGLAEAAARSLFPLLLLAAFALTHGLDSHARVRAFVVRRPAAVVVPVLAAAWVLAITISAGSSAKFIYFDF